MDDFIEMKQFPNGKELELEYNSADECYYVCVWEHDDVSVWLGTFYTEEGARERFDLWKGYLENE